MIVRKNVILTAVLAAAIALAVSSPAWSHHSHAMFDHDKEVTIKGTVTDWVFRTRTCSSTSTSRPTRARR